MESGQLLTVFAGPQRVAAGDPSRVARAVQALFDAGDRRPVLSFDDATGAQVELDLGDGKEIAAPGSAPKTHDPGVGADPTDKSAPRRAPGRPKLGVVGREITLLPRHWDWLNAQPGGASVALRKLVEQARRDNASKDRMRRSQEAAFRFMSAIAGNEPGFEEASRSLFAGDRTAFNQNMEAWPPDVRDYACALAAEAFGSR
jgi:hypothetical protein